MIPVMNVSRQYENLAEKLDKTALEVLHSGGYIMGSAVAELEKNFAEYIGVKYAIGVGNGTDAITISLRALGIGTGDEVITTAMSFYATAEAIASVGATPVFADITEDTYTLNPNDIEHRITNKTKAILPVHLYGQCADMDAIIDIAKRNNLYVIEDCAQAAGARYKGRRAGSMGDIACVSFFPTKNLGGVGDGGMILTNDERLAKACQAYRVHGSGQAGYETYAYQNGLGTDEKPDFHGNLPKYYNYLIGYNSRLDTLDAALINVKLPYLDKWNETRVRYAMDYDNKITNGMVHKPKTAEYNDHIFYVYVIKTKDAAGFREYMKSKDVGTGVYFPVALHLQDVFKELGYKKGDFPIAEELAEQGVAIPMFPELTDDERKTVIEAVNSYKA